MASGPGLALKMTADTAGIARGISRTEKLLGNLSKSTRSAASAMNTLVAIKVGEILTKGFMSATTAISGYVSSIRTAVDETAKVAQRTGIAVEALQGFQVAAGLSGVQNLEGALQKVTIVLGDAAAGSEQAQKALRNIGLSAEELMAMAPEDQFRAIAKAIGGIQGQANQAAAAVDLFGKSGVELLPLFASNLEEVEARAQRLGIVLSGDQTKAIEDMNDALSWVQRTFEGIIGQVTANLAPIVTAMTEEFLSFVEAFEGVGGGGGTGIADVLTEGLLDFAEYLAGVFDAALEQFGSFGETMSTVAGVFQFVTNTFVAVAETLRAAFNFFELTGNFIAEIIGGLLQGLGSFVSRDLEAFGKQLRENANAAGRRNVEEMASALGNAGTAILGGSAAGSAGGGPASRVVQSVRDRFQNRNSPEAQAEREARRAERQAERDAANAARIAQQEQERIAKEAERIAQEQAKIEEKRLQDIGRLNEQYAEKSTEIEASRLDKLSRANQQALEASDIRSGGISQFLALATGREDPAVAEARAQRQELEKISAEIRKLGGTVELVGAA